ncbi:MAG TPA: hypothetical protein VHK24_15310 [Steroidobacter sp.]|jgi:hypothetical protein|nr:hypothetical protein [Steroidobacter sp.]
MRCPSDVQPSGLRFIWSALALTLIGCTTVQNYDGERRTRDEVARISGDFPVTAGAPVTVILRRVDDRSLALREHAVEVLPGSHRLVVDCRIAETAATSRHVLDAEVSAGVRYRLVAETAPGLRGCASVRLQALD